MRSRYDLMKESEVRDLETNETYFDSLTFPIQNFSYIDNPYPYQITESEKLRIDILMARVYGVYEYDDIVLQLSDIDFLYDAELETDLFLPDKRDIERFFLDNKIILG